MGTYVAIPKLGMSMTEATLIEWLAPEGARVAAGDVVLSIETDKTVWEVESAASGFLHLVVQEDETVPVGRVVGIIAADEGELSKLQSRASEVIMTTVAEPDEESGQRAPGGESPPSPAAAGERKAPAPEPRSKVRISPAARKIAEDHGLDPAKIEGTGPGGRIVRADVERAVEASLEGYSGPAGADASPKPVAASAAGAAPSSPAGGESVEGREVVARIPLRGMRRSIAQHMQASLAGSAQLTYMGEAEMTAVVALRDSLLRRE